MNKRSAVLVASGLVLAMISAAFGIMMGFTGPSSAGTEGVHVRAARKPVVKTVTDKRTIHKTAPETSGSTTVVLTRTSAPCAFKNFAAAKPLLPRPRTATFFPFKIIAV